MWLLLSLLGYLLLAVTTVLDKLILTKSIDKPVVYTFYSTIPFLLFIFAYPFGIGLLNGLDWWWALFSGLAFGFGIWTFYLAIKKGEATHISPFNGAIIAIFTYFFASHFLVESVSNFQIFGLVILIVATLLLSFEETKDGAGFHIGYVWAVLSGVLFAASHVSAKYLYGLYPFWTGFIWSKAAVGFVGLVILFMPTVWRKIHRSKKKKKRIKGPNALSLVIISKILVAAATIILQYAAAVGSVSLVFALAGSQYVIMFIMIYLLSKFAKKWFSEYFTKREIAVQIVALILVTIGLGLMV